MIEPTVKTPRSATTFSRMAEKISAALRAEWALFFSGATSAIFLGFGARWLAQLESPAWCALMSSWLFGAILVASFAVVRHAESLAVRLGEPLGTLLLTLSVTGIEVTLIAAVMYTGHGNAALARDAMFGVVMIVLNGMVGLSLLLGGIKHHEQTYNLQGANAFLAVIVPLTVLGLVLPNFTVSSPGPTYAPLQAAFLIVMSVGLYVVFLAIQNSRHRDYFLAPQLAATQDFAPDGKLADAVHTHAAGPLGYHIPLLIAYLLAVVFLAKQLALPINYAIHELHAPLALGGFLVSVLVLTPESLGAARAALDNQLQRAVNLLLGSVLASISLTIPAVLTIGFMTDQTIVLGLDPADMILLVLTLAVSMLTFASARTNVLLGAVHLLLFGAYLMMIFDG